MNRSASALQGLRLSEERIQELIRKAHEWALLHGIVLYCISDPLVFAQKIKTREHFCGL